MKPIWKDLNVLKEAIFAKLKAKDLQEQPKADKSSLLCLGGCFGKILTINLYIFSKSCLWKKKINKLHRTV